MFGLKPPPACDLIAVADEQVAVVRIDRHVLRIVATERFEIKLSQFDGGIVRIHPGNLEFVVVGDVHVPRAGVEGQASRLICEVQEAVRLVESAVGLQLPQVRGAQERAFLNFRVADEETLSGHVGYSGGIRAATAPRSISGAGHGDNQGDFRRAASTARRYRRLLDAR
jgi:hypothetical protein